MEYYVIRPSLDVEIIGHYPQVEEAKHNCNVWNEPRFINNYHFEKIDFEPVVSNAIVKNSAKVTDFIEASVTGFTNKLLVSGKLKNILQKYKKNGIQYFQSGVYHKKEFFKDLNINRSELGVEIHHLIERRFAKLFNVDPNKMKSIVLTVEEHGIFTKAWRGKIPYTTASSSVNSLHTATATRAQVEAVAREIYKNYPDILKALGL